MGEKGECKGLDKVGKGNEVNNKYKTTEGIDTEIVV